MKYTFIGAGNVATHLATALTKSGNTILEIHSRSESGGKALARKTNARFVDDLSRLNPNTGLFILAVPDDEISHVIRSFPFPDRCVVHTSGAVPLSVFPARFTNAGVLYPLQTLSKGVRIRWNNVPFCLEGRSEKIKRALRSPVNSLEGEARWLSSEQRAWAHLCAVLVNNFSNHLFVWAELLMKEKGMDLDLLHPLMLETTRKAIGHSPATSQTGPAKRGDTDTLERHLSLLAGHKDLQEIYRLLSESIARHHGMNY